MPIGSAVQIGHKVVVYDLDGHPLFSKLGELYGFTGQALTIRRDGSHLLTIYDEHGRQLANVPGPRR